MFGGKLLSLAVKAPVIMLLKRLLTILVGYDLYRRQVLQRFRHVLSRH